LSHYFRVVDGDVGGLLLEVGDGVAAAVHDLLDEDVRFDERPRGVVHEAGLERLPLGGVAVPLLRRELLDRQAFHASLAFGELAFGRAAAVADER